MKSLAGSAVALYVFGTRERGLGGKGQKRHSPHLVRGRQNFQGGTIQGGFDEIGVPGGGDRRIQFFFESTLRPFLTQLLVQ